VKKIIIGAAVALLGAGSVASAADLPVKARPMPVSPAFDWSGFYVGVNGGYGWNDDGPAAGITYSSPVTGFAGTSGGFRPKGGFGGGQIGYNWQQNQVVFGVEADIQGSNIKDSFNVTVPSNSGPLGVVAAENVNYFGTVRGRVGYAWDQTLIYGTGGFAYGGVKDSFLLTNGGATALLAGSSVGYGFAAGAGVEYHFTPAWSVKGEYQYVDLGNMRVSGISTNAVPLNTTSIDTKFHTVRIGINYRWGGPILAKY
jgi:outer membrane immunogenic protein